MYINVILTDNFKREFKGEFCLQNDNIVVKEVCDQDLFTVHSTYVIPMKNIVHFEFYYDSKKYENITYEEVTEE